MEKYFFHTEKMTVGYDGKPLIKDIEINLEKGRILTLIGPNGSGKSTILKSITKQLKMICGTVYLDNHSINAMSNKKLSKKLAVVLTERLRTELMTCEDVVATGRYPYTGSLGILSDADKEKVREAMELVHAWDLKDRDFTAISDGQRQRILLARAICQGPEIIVLDEPTSYLDIRHKLELLNLLRQMVAEKGVTVIMSLHELDFAQKVSDYIMCVKGEYVEKYGTPKEIFSSEFISRLYDLTDGGSYNAAFGTLEMEPPEGEPRVFVIAGDGRGIEVYRRLQRSGVPFATGVLHKNDMDFQVAEALASEVVSEEPFDPISDRSYEKALSVMQKCGIVICCLNRFGKSNARNADLLMEAKQRGMLKNVSDVCINGDAKCD